MSKTEAARPLILKGLTSVDVLDRPGDRHDGLSPLRHVLNLVEADDGVHAGSRPNQPANRS